MTETRSSRITALLVLLLAAAPALVLVVNGIAGANQQTWAEIAYRPFWAAVGRSAKQMVASGTIAWLIGLPLGTMLGLFRFPLKRLCYMLLAVPLLMPPFLWAIGFQSLKPFFSYRNQTWVDGFMGCVLAYATQLVPLVAIAGALAASQITRSELNVARLHGGWEAAIWQSLRQGIPATGGATLLGTMLPLADFGCGQIMGYIGASGEILIAFSAKQDFQLAAVKTLVICCIFLPVVVIGAWLLSRTLLAGGNARGILRPALRIEAGVAGRLMVSIAMLLAGGTLVLPALFGLVRPLLQPPAGNFVTDAFELLAQSVAPTLHYTVVAGLLAPALAVIAVSCITPGSRFSVVVLSASLVLFGLPPALNALGMLRIGSAAPQEFDIIFRSGWVVGIAHALHLLPLAIILLMAAWWRIPNSIPKSAQLCGIRGTGLVFRLMLPLILPAFLAVMGLTGVLALADVSSTILLQPPGGSSYGTHLFAVMDNSAEKVVAALCLVYALIPAIILLPGWLLFVSCRFLNNLYRPAPSRQ